VSSSRQEAVPGTRPGLNNRPSASARSLLLTLLGEFVLPRPGPVWTQAIVGVLDRLGVEEKAARQALARTAADGWLRSQRVGRSVRWSLTDPGRRLLTDGAERIYAFAARQPDWDGSWFILNVSVPESTRSLRHQLRTRLSWAGFGSPEPGMWISPSTAHEAEASAIIGDLGLAGQAMSFTARFAGIGHEQAMVERAWDLAAVDGQYEQFIAKFTGLRPATDDEALLAQARLVNEWRRFPFLDPELPLRLLPPRWSGTRARQLFEARHAAWDGPAGRRWDELAQAAGPRGDQGDLPA
jgi:phenylacetic acid degradation operon negative regulatory protein